MDSVLANQTLLNQIIAEGDKEEGDKEGKYGVEKLVREVVKEVYEKVDSLREEMEFMLEKKWTRLPLGVGWEGGEWGGEDVEMEERGEEIMKRDFDYLVKMKEMDKEIELAKKEGTREKKKLEMSEVVPMAGLVMARFHVYNCELSTSIEHWKMMEEIEREKRRMMRMKSEKMAKVWVGCSPGVSDCKKKENQLLRGGWRL